MEIEQSVDVLPLGSKPHVVVGQIHDKDDDVTVFRVEGNRTGDRSLATLWITDGDKTHGYKLTDSYRLGTRFRVGFHVQDGVIRYMYNDAPVDYVQEKTVSGCYFKAGSYCQSGGNVTRLPDGRADYAQVTIYALQVCHNGVCTGRAPAPQVQTEVAASGDIAQRLAALETTLAAHVAGTDARVASLEKRLAGLRDALQ